MELNEFPFQCNFAASTQGSVSISQFETVCLFALCAPFSFIHLLVFLLQCMCIGVSVYSEFSFLPRNSNNSNQCIRFSKQIAISFGMEKIEKWKNCTFGNGINMKHHLIHAPKEEWEKRRRNRIDCSCLWRSIGKRRRSEREIIRNLASFSQKGNLVKQRVKKIRATPRLEFLMNGKE